MAKIPGPAHRSALAQATDELIASDRSGLPADRIISQVAAASNEIVRGHNLMGDDMPTPEEYVRIVVKLARKDLEYIQRGATDTTELAPLR
jgi:hypothetical protein